MTGLDRQPGQDHERGLELAASAVDFELTKAERAELEAHLASCPTCTRRAAAMRADSAALGRPLGLLPSARVDATIAAEIARGPAQPQRLVLVAAAALLALALLGAAAIGASLLRDWQQTLPITVVPSVPDPIAVVSPRPDGSSAPVAETWGTIAIPTSDTGDGWIGLMKSITTAESRFVAVGRPVCAPQNDPTTCHASVWTAGPGEGWSRAPDQPGLKVGTEFPTSGPEPGMLDVTAGPGGFVAIGYDSDPRAGGPAVWRSPDGRTWERVQVDFGASPAEASSPRVVAVTAGPQGYVIVGHAIAGFSASAPAVTARAAAWTSPDGESWTRAADTADLDAGPCQDTGEEPDCGGMSSVTWTGSGFVAVGTARTDGGQTSQPAAWISPDGLIWTGSDGGLDFEGRLSGVTVGGPGLVAVGLICPSGCANSANGVAVTSRDGSTWTAAPIDGAGELERVVAFGGHVFALARQGPGNDPPAKLELWRSADGIAWQRRPDLPSIADLSSYRAIDLAASTDRLVVAGWADTGGIDNFVNFSYAATFAGPTLVPPVSPGPTPGADPPATPPPGASVATSVDPVVLLRVEIRPDVSVGRMPMLTVYQDGTVLRRDDSGATITRLTPQGLETLLSAARNDPLFAANGVIGPDPTYTGGVTGYTIGLRRGDQMVVRSTTNAPAAADRAEAESIIALADRLTDLGSWALDGWATGPTEAEPYLASDYLLKVTVFNQPGIEYPSTALDRADVDWPLTGSLEGFGKIAADQPLGNGTTSRCGLLTLAEATAVRNALAAAPFNPVAENLQAELDWAPSIRHITLTLVPLLPDDQRDCSVDQSWP